ncbi:hypothetical protein [Candidatus Poriferisodalis sp.]|uniref:hypothetical protein n=1 Tax=Candidatus Poriferisodalis sp. TaxID=3101277 RepID=UPI003B01B7EA
MADDTAGGTSEPSPRLQDARGWRPGPRRTAEAGGPFSEPDMWLGARTAPVGLQRALEPGDRPGPLSLKLPESSRSQTVPAAMGVTSSDRSPERLDEIWFAPSDGPIDEVRVLGQSVAVRDGVVRGLARNLSRRLWAYELTVSAAGHEFVWPLSVQPGEIAPFEIHGWEDARDDERIEISIDADMSWHPDPSRAFSSFGSLKTLLAGEPARRLLAGSVRDRYPQVTADVAPDAVSAGVLVWEGAALRPPAASHPSLLDEIGSLAVRDLRGYGALFDRDGRVVDVAAAPVGRLFWPDDGDPRDPANLAATPEGRLFWPDYGDDFEWPQGTSEPRWEAVPSLPHRDIDLPRVHLHFDVHAQWPDLEWKNWRLPPSNWPLQLRVESEDGDWRREDIEGGFIFWIGAGYPARQVLEE